MNDQKYEELKTILKLILVKTPIAEYPDLFTRLILEVAFNEVGGFERKGLRISEVITSFADEFLIVSSRHVT